MDDIYWFYARKAGFLFWEKESWNYRNRRIDWSSDYDDELQKYTQLVIEHTLNKRLEEFGGQLDATFVQE